MARARAKVRLDLVLAAFQRSRISHASNAFNSRVRILKLISHSLRLPYQVIYPYEIHTANPLTAHHLTREDCVRSHCHRPRAELEVRVQFPAATAHACKRANFGGKIPGRAILVYVYVYVCVGV